MRYLVLPKEGGFAVIDSHVGLPVTLSMSLATITPNEQDASRYAETLNRCAEMLRIDKEDNAHPVT